MARINIEDCWWTDPRRSALIRTLGDEELADGVVSKAWRVAQEFWKHGRKLVPKSIFETLRHADKLLGVGLAEIRGDDVYIRGSSAYLEWIAEKREAGRKGGLAKARKRKQPVADASKGKQTLPSASYSSSSSGSNTQNEESIGAADAAALPSVSEKNLGLGRSPERGTAKAETAIKANRFVGAYVKAYQTRFPDRRPEDLNDGKVKGQILNWIAGYPLERACDLIQVYFQMDTKWFTTKGYDFLTFRNNLNVIGQSLDSGEDPGGGKIDIGKLRAERGGKS